MSAKVAYIAGLPRSGTTLLANTLGGIDGFFSGGELAYLWKPGVRTDNVCGCGRDVGDCELWREVLGRLGRGPDVEEIGRSLDSRMRTRWLPALIAEQRLGRRTARVLEADRSTLARLYEAIRDATASRVIVDSSKLPSYGHMLAGAPRIDVRLVHLVRDPRATAFSAGGRRSAGPRSSAMSALRWVACHGATEALWRGDRDRYLRVSYEEFVARPRAVLEAIARLLDEPDVPSGVVDDDTVSMEVNHTVEGSPHRFRSGTVEIREDDAWRTKLRPLDRRVVTLLTSPLLRRYGYSASI